MTGAMSVTHAELVEGARRWLLNTARWRCPVVVTEIATLVSETPDVLGFGPGYSVLVECKTSRSDFAADAQKSFRRFPEGGMGTWRYYLAPEGVLKFEDLPDGWGLLSMRMGPRRGLYVWMNCESARHDAHWQAERIVLLSAIRRMRFDEGTHVSARVYKWFRDDPRTTITIEPEAVGEALR